MTYKNIVFDLDDTLYDHLLPFKNSIIKCFPELDISDDLALTFQKTYEKELSSITLFPELKEILEYCSVKKIPIGIITNGSVKHQLKKLSQLEVV
jgi:putative hydrolase of the HAD superfamily